MASENTVTIYQNGIAAFERTYEVGEQAKRLSLPFKKDYIGDVAATLSILGNGVEVVEAPNYNPNKEEPTFKITPSKPTDDLFTKLSGAEVTITKTGANAQSVTGRVTGYQTENNILQNGTVVPQHYVTIEKADHSFERFNFNTDVAGYTFTNPAIQSLIKKALDWNFESINPDSVYLNTTLKSAKPAKAVLKYAIPSPAFKLSYRLRQGTGKNAKWTLTGFGIVDNNTDEDWTNFNINCATGQPVTFATDIADIRIPVRQKINLVADQAIGAVEAESGYLEAASFAPAAAGGGTKSLSRGARPAPVAALQSLRAESTADLENALQSVAAAVEIGDGSFFQGKEPVTIPAKKSALVKIIEEKLDDAFSCLYYQPSRGAIIMRALKVTNKATFTLGRGVCAIEQEGNHVGEAVLTLCKPGETSMLCYAQETGVKVLCEVGQERSKCMKHNLADGMLVSEWSKGRTTVYTFRNPKAEKFTLLFDHVPHLSGSTQTCDGAEVISKLSGGAMRYSVNIPPKEEKDSTITITVTENMTTHQTVKAGDFLEWIIRNPDSPLLKQPGLEAIIQIYKELQGCNQETKTAQEKLQSLRNEQERIRKNVDTLKGVTNAEAQANLSKITGRLMAAEEEIVKIEQTTLPELSKKHQGITNRIREAVAKATAGWSNPDETEASRTKALHGETHHTN